MNDTPPGPSDNAGPLSSRVHSACDHFEAAWKAARSGGQRTRIEDHLRGIPEPEQPALLRELILLDVHYRRREGEQPRPEDYLERFQSLSPAWVAAQLRELPSEACSAPHGPERPRAARSAPITLPRTLVPPGPMSDEAQTTAEESPGEAALLAPTVPGYDILGEVARGAMGCVYKARQVSLNRPVAIKVMLPRAPAERFLREAKVLASVASPYVVAVHDFHALPDGTRVLVMEWVEGANLLQVMRSKGVRLREEEALPWMTHTAKGMLAAAEQGIIHRDFKPSNVLVDSKGRARVADFGLACGPGELADLTHERDVLGTYYYMAPEQAEDPHGVDTRADIYSFGATFYHALTGVPPFDGKTPFAVQFKHKMEPLVPPKARNHDLSARLSDLLERCLAKSPGDRFPSFAEILRHLQPAAGLPSPWDESNDTELEGYLARYQGRREAYLGGGLAWGEADTYSFPHGQTLRVVRGDIVHQEVDAIVSSEFSHLLMEYGVSLAIRRAAGGTVAEEARRYSPVRPGRAVVTSAGALKARFVFHGVTFGVSGQEFVAPSRDLISEIMASCFYHADSLDVRSLAFPLLGTGGGGFPADVCLDTIFRFLARTFLRGLTSVRSAMIVIYEPRLLLLTKQVRRSLFRRRLSW